MSVLQVMAYWLIVPSAKSICWLLRAARAMFKIHCNYLVGLVLWKSFSARIFIFASDTVNESLNSSKLGPMFFFKWLQQQKINDLNLSWSCWLKYKYLTLWYNAYYPYLTQLTAEKSLRYFRNVLQLIWFPYTTLIRCILMQS